MFRKVRRRYPSWPLLCAGVAAVSIAHAASQQTQQSPQVFRARTTVIPVDVRVLDRNGRPITGLSAADFTILENDRPQKIEYFSSLQLTPAEPDPGGNVRLTSGTASSGLKQHNRRLFLIILGRGRLQEPSKGIDATLRFVRQRLLPQDQVAVMAWNRATDFTTDHQKAAEIIERFKIHHEAVEALMQQRYMGLGGYYGGGEISRDMQVIIDRVFGSPANPGTSRQVLPSQALGRAESDARNTFERMKTSELEAFRAFGGSDVRLADAMVDPTLPEFDDYVALNRQTMQDVGNLYAGIDYLRYIDGEKHIIFVTEQGFQLPRADHDRDLATVAADARVAIDTLQTGGVATAGIGAGTTVVGGFKLAALREISEFTGGQVSVSQMADKAYDRILSSTEFGYLLGYTSDGPPPNGRPRSIKVEVKRRGVNVSYRKAYVARNDQLRYDPRQSLATTRLVSAASHPGDIRDLRFTSKLKDGKDGAGRFVEVELTIEADRVVFARAGDQYLAALNVAIICADYYGKNIGERWATADIKIPPARMDEVRKMGLVIPLQVRVALPPNTVRIMVYDYGSDLLGSSMKRMR